MRASRIILLLVALLAGGLAAFLATRGDAPQPVEVPGPTKVIEEAKAQILVAKTAIGVGQRLTEDTVEWQDWPELAVRPEYVDKKTKPDATTQMADAVARFEFFPGEPIMEAKLVHSDQGYLSAVLPAGMRGVSVQVNAESASGGFIFPNDRVDVVLTHSSSSGGMVSETILSNIKVLAIAKRLGETGTTGKPTDPADPGADVFQGTTIATLELDPSQGETVINSGKIGTLSLVLRSIADYAATPDQSDSSRNNNRAIRVIRFGKGSDVMSARPTGEDAGEQKQASVSPDTTSTPAAATPAPRPQ